MEDVGRLAPYGLRSGTDCCGGHLCLWEKEEGQEEDHVDECCRYQSQSALLISSRPRCLLTLNDTPVRPMASLRWQRGRPPLLKCKSGFNLKQSRPAEIIFLPSSQVLFFPFSFLLPSPRYFSDPSPLFFQQLDPQGTRDGESIFRRSDR